MVQHLAKRFEIIHLFAAFGCKFPTVHSPFSFCIAIEQAFSLEKSLMMLEDDH